MRILKFNKPAGAGFGESRETCPVVQGHGWRRRGVGRTTRDFAFDVFDVFDVCTMMPQRLLHCTREFDPHRIAWRTRESNLHRIATGSNAGVQPAPDRPGRRAHAPPPPHGPRALTPTPLTHPRMSPPRPRPPRISPTHPRPPRMNTHTPTPPRPHTTRACYGRHTPPAGNRAPHPSVPRTCPPRTRAPPTSARGYLAAPGTNAGVGPAPDRPGFFSIFVCRLFHIALA